MRRLLLALLFIIPLAHAAFTAQLIPNNLSLQPGDHATSILSIIANETTINITSISLNTTSLANLSISLSLTSIPFTIQNGTQENLTLSIAYDHPWPAGNYTLPITIMDNTSFTQDLTLNVTLLPTSSGNFTISPSVIELGSSSQERDVTLTTPLILQNDQASSVTNLTLTFTGSSRYNVTFTPSPPYTLNPHTNLTVQMRVYVPLDQDAGRAWIGNISYTATSGEHGSIPVYLTTRSLIRITDVDVITSEGDDSNLHDGERIAVDLKPGSRMEFTIRLENPADETDIDTAHVTLTIKDIDDGDDLIIESDEFSIPADDYEKVTLNLTIPYTADEGTYDVIIKAEGEDEHGADHSAVQENELRVEKDAHDIRIKRLDVPSSAYCTDETLPVDVTLINTGRRDEPAAWVNASIKGTSISMVRATMLDKRGSDREETLTLRLPINDLEEGVYTVEVRAGYDRQAYVTDYAETSFTLICPREEEASPGETSGTSESDGNETIIIITQPAEESDTAPRSGTDMTRTPGNGTSSESAGEQEDEQTGGWDRHVLALIIANAILIGVIIALIILLA